MHCVATRTGVAKLDSRWLH